MGSEHDSPEERRELPRSSLPSLNLGDHSWRMPPTEVPAAGRDGAVKSHEWDPPSMPDKPENPFPGGKSHAKETQQSQKASDPVEHHRLLAWFTPCLGGPYTACD